jgi:hypothetical protein
VRTCDLLQLRPCSRLRLNTTRPLGGRGLSTWASIRAAAHKSIFGGSTIAHPLGHLRVPERSPGFGDWSRILVASLALMTR